LLRRSYTAVVLTPHAPVSEWLAELDASLSRSPSIYVAAPVVVDLSAMAAANNDVAELIASLRQRSIAVMGLEGLEGSTLGSELPPQLSGQRCSTTTDQTEAEKLALGRKSKGRGKRKAAAIEVTSAPEPGVTPFQPIDGSDFLRVSGAPSQAPKQSSSLVLESPVRSGQSVCFQEGDLTVLGSVGSGAEVLAGGSIHVYGTLRGRAMAGSGGNSQARIFCQKLEAEMLSIDGYYRTADDIDEQLRSRPVQAWLDGNTIMITALN
jgi:septum site-determining protein MinC